MENLVNFFINAFSGLDKNVVVFLISIVSTFGIKRWYDCCCRFQNAIFTGYGTLLIRKYASYAIYTFIYYKDFDALKKTKLFKPMVQKIENKAMGKSDKIQKYEFLGILLFVGIPLPGTGAWTGALIAALLGIKLRKSIPAILCGIFLASAIMSCVTYLIPAIISMI